MKRLILVLTIALSGACDEEKSVIEEEEPLFVDNDGDGFPIPEDCDDGNPAIKPNVEEFCDGVDNNCDGQIDEGVLLAFYADDDEDGFGDPEQSLEACTNPSGYVPFGNDCNDAASMIHPGAPESCNEIDDDCDGEVDEDLIDGLYYDGDGDGHGDPNLPSTDCQGGEGYVFYGDDCNDSDPEIRPYAEEICDGIDNDCNGVIDDSVANTYYADNDNDGYGDAANTTQGCTVPAGFVDNDSDCDGADSEQYPGAPEYCNSEDDDCDGDVDEDALDSPTWYYDIDGDGFGSAFITAVVCDMPVGYVQTDTDCDDTNTSIYPGATEYCNSKDNDCNGQIDDNAADAFTWYADFDRDDFGDPANSLYQCEQPFDYILQQGDCDDADDAVNPDAPELCNAVDDDCDGIIDNNTIDSFDYFLDADGDGFGDPSQLLQDCQAPLGYILNDEDCDDGNSDIYPGAPELCDGIDQNCNGNNFYELDLDGNGYLACEESIWFRNSSNNNTNPNGNCSQAANHLGALNISIGQYNHANNFVTASLLQDYGLFVHHGKNPDGAIRAYTNAEAYALQEWVYNGGRFLYMGHHTDPSCDIIDSIPSQFGFSCTPGNPNLSGSTNVFVGHPVTAGLALVGGEGGADWNVSPPAESLVQINGTNFVMAAEYGAGKVLVVSNQYPFYNPGSGYRINYGDNETLIQNIWDWLLD